MRYGAPKVRRLSHKTSALLYPHLKPYHASPQSLHPTIEFDELHSVVPPGFLLVLAQYISLAPITGHRSDRSSSEDCRATAEIGGLLLCTPFLLPSFRPIRRVAYMVLCCILLKNGPETILLANSN